LLKKRKPIEIRKFRKNAIFARKRMFCDKNTAGSKRYNDLNIVKTMSKKTKKPMLLEAKYTKNGTVGTKVVVSTDRLIRFSYCRNQQKN
jgi:hypothetical protein